MLFILHTLLVLMVCSLVGTAFCGRMLKISRSFNVDPEYSNTASYIWFKYHTFFGNAVMVTTIALVVFTEIMIRLQKIPGPNYHSHLFWVHELFNVAFCGTFVTAKFLVTGLEHPRLHGWIAKNCLIAATGTIITGILLLINIG